jgi:hypothetical protein
MSVDIVRLSGHLSPAQQRSLKSEYSAREKNPTTAFLLCFFLGIFGAHRFYLGQPGQGLLRLILSPLIVPGLIWELVDLFRIDGEVFERNLKLAEELVARAALAQPNAAVEAEALARLDAALREQEAASAPAPAPAPAASSGAAIPAAAPGSVDADVPFARASEPPSQPIAMDAVLADGSASLAAPVHLVQDDDEHTAPPSLEPTTAAHDIWEDAWDEALLAQPPIPPSDQPSADEPPADETYSSRPDVDVTPDAVAYVPIADAEWAPLGDAGVSVRAVRPDPTDRPWDPGGPPPTADVGEGRSARVRVALPELTAYEAEIAGAASWVVPVSSARTPPSVPPAARSEMPITPSWSGKASSAQEELPTLIFYPADTDEPQTSSAVQKETLAALAGSAATAGAAERATGEPEITIPALESSSTPKAAPEPAAYEAHVTEELHDQPNEGTRRVVKRVRVVRRLVVNGQVVHEASAEQIVDPDADTTETATALREALGSTDPETLAALANVPLPEAPSDVTDPPPDPSAQR